MAMDAAPAPSGRFAPLGEPTFRRVWSASLLANFGQLILGVGASWEMTRLTSSPGMVALVQTALMLPLMLVSVPAGAFADMFDRRRIALAGLAFAVASAAALTALSYAGLTTPWLLLAFCALIGAGVALYSPAWQASIGEQVGPALLPAAVALGTISYNLARSFGPALGGVIVLLAGAKSAFALTAVSFAPLFLAFLLWRRPGAPARLPPERFDRAVLSGARYIRHSPPVRRVLVRAAAFGLAGASLSALAPLIARDLLGGDASTYGLLLGASGVGAVLGALLVEDFRARLGTEGALRLLALSSGAALALAALSRELWLTCACLAWLGASNILTIALLNVAVQLGAPRWVTARALSLFGAALTGGIAIGAAAWGAVAARIGLENTLLASAALLGATAALGFAFRVEEASDEGAAEVSLPNEPDVALALTLRSGPVAIEIDYRVDPEQARAFYDAMRAVARARRRNGAYDWSLERDIADPALWTERYHCPTWGDYLRLRARYTQADSDAQLIADAFLMPGARHVVRRRLERPLGSVRWKPDSPDFHTDLTGVRLP